MFIYKITNKVNGKVYIGQTRDTIIQRFKGHINCARSGDGIMEFRVWRLSKG